MALIYGVTPNTTFFNGSLSYGHCCSKLFVKKTICAGKDALTSLWYVYPVRSRQLFSSSDQSTFEYHTTANKAEGALHPSVFVPGQFLLSDLPIQTCLPVWDLLLISRLVKFKLFQYSACKKSGSVHIYFTPTARPNLLRGAAVSRSLCIVLQREYCIDRYAYAIMVLLPPCSRYAENKTR